MIGIVSALKEEINSLRNELAVSKVERIGNREYYLGTLYGKEVVMVWSNVGKVSAATTITILIEHFQVELVVFTGVAGGADNSVKIGDVIVADGLIQHDFDISTLSNLPKYDNTLLGKSLFDVKKSNVDLLKATIQHYLEQDFKSDICDSIRETYQLHNPQVITGVIASGDQFIADKSKIEELNQGIRNLKCVDMESAAAAQICYEYGKDFIVFRIISDNADKSADINFDRFLNDVATIYSRGILKQLLNRL